MTIKNVVLRGSITVSPETCVCDVAKILMDSRQRAVPVVLAGCPVGIITETDLLIRSMLSGADPHTATAFDVMTRWPICAKDSDPVESAVATMKKHSIRRLVVWNPDGLFVGMVCLEDLAQYCPTDVAQEILRRALEEPGKESFREEMLLVPGLVEASA